MYRRFDPTFEFFLPRLMHNGHSWIILEEKSLKKHECKNENEQTVVAKINTETHQT